MDHHVQLDCSQHGEQAIKHDYTAAKWQSSVYDTAALMSEHC